MTSHKKILSSVKISLLVLWITITFILIIESILSFLYLSTYKEQLLNYMPKADTYSGADWIEGYTEELADAYNPQWKPHVCWRNTPYQGKYLNINNHGIRKTWTTDKKNTNGDRLKIFMFGGSTMWGYGSRDEFTIPSILAKKLFENGIDAEITNFGENGYTSTQEMTYLINELKTGNEPNLVIFYDGFNDTTTAVLNQYAGGIHTSMCQQAMDTDNKKEENIIKRRWTFSIEKMYINRLMKNISNYLMSNKNSELVKDKFVEYKNRKVADDVVRTYVANMKIVQSLAKNHLFNVIFYWQPNLFDKNDLSKFEKSIRKNHLEFGKYENFFMLVNSILRSSNWAKENANVFHDISSIFYKNKEPLFIDTVHLGEKGDEYIAERMATDVLLKIRRDRKVSADAPR